MPLTPRGWVPLTPRGWGSSAPQLLGFLSINAYTLCCRTTKFDVEPGFLLTSDFRPVLSFYFVYNQSSELRFKLQTFIVCM